MAHHQTSTILNYIVSSIFSFSLFLSPHVPDTHKTRQSPALTRKAKSEGQVLVQQYDDPRITHRYYLPISLLPLSITIATSPHEFAEAQPYLPEAWANDNLPVKHTLALSTAWSVRFHFYFISSLFSVIYSSAPSCRLHDKSSISNVGYHFCFIKIHSLLDIVYFYTFC